MSTVAQIKNALKETLSALDGVDQAEINNYLPPVITERIALVIPPFGQETRVDVLTTAGNRFTAESQTTMTSHRIRCEFWVKLNTGNLPYVIARASSIAHEAIALLFNNPTLGGRVDRMGNFGQGDNRQSISSETIDQPISVGGVPYIVVIVNVPVIDYRG